MKNVEEDLRHSFLTMGMKYSSICLGKKGTKNLRQDKLSSLRKLNCKNPKYEIGGITATKLGVGRHNVAYL
jgi:hypothetical protein